MTGTHDIDDRPAPSGSPLILACCHYLMRYDIKIKSALTYLAFPMLAFSIYDTEIMAARRCGLYCCLDKAWRIRPIVKIGASSHASQDARHRHREHGYQSRVRHASFIRRCQGADAAPADAPAINGLVSGHDANDVGIDQSRSAVPQSSEYASFLMNTASAGSR